MRALAGDSTITSRALATAGPANAYSTEEYRITFGWPDPGSLPGGGVVNGMVDTTETPLVGGRQELLGGGSPVSGTAATPPDGLTNTLWAWCIQPTEYYRPGTEYTYLLTELEDAPVTLPGTTMSAFDLDGANGSNTAADAMRYLVGTLNPDLDGFITTGVLNGTTDQTLLRQAFHAAVWEIANERTTAYDVEGGGSFSYAVSDPVEALANAWLADIVEALDGDVTTAQYAWTPADGGLQALTSGSTLGNHQDFLVRVRGNPPAADVPLPAAGWLFGSAVIGMIATARRRRKVADV